VALAYALGESVELLGAEVAVGAPGELPVDATYGRLVIPQDTRASAGMHGLIDPFYEKCEPSVEPGQDWCDQHLYLPPSHGLKVTRVDPKDDRNLEYSVCGRTTEIFDHAPVHSLSMESSEGAVVAKTKRTGP
jgi:hypothetical protein